MFLFESLCCMLLLLEISPNFHATAHVHYRNGSRRCLAKNYGTEGDNKIVCVCNETYCDTVKSLESFLDGHFIRYTSSKSGLRLERTRGRIENNVAEGGITIQLLPNIQFQTINGFGGAFTDSAGINIKSLSENLQHQLIRSYFAKDGLEYSTGRVPIGGTDFSTRPYEYDEVANDTSLSHFNLTQEDFLYKIPYIRQAMNLREGDLKLIATAWSAPNWMKTNNDITGFGLLKTEYYQTWADYYIRFFELYQMYGNISFWAVTTGNEPANGLFPERSFNNMGWTPVLVRNWIAVNLGSTIRRNPKFSNIKILALDDQRYFLPWWVDMIFKNSTARNYIDGIAVHWYADWLTPTDNLDATHLLFPEKFILYTEASLGSEPPIDGPRVDLGSWSRGEQYAQSIISVLNHYSSGWTDWNLAVDLTGGPNWVGNYVDAPILVNATANKFYKQPMYYALGHFSKFIPPNSVRISYSTSNDTDLKILVVVRPDARTVVVILNDINEDREVSIQLINSQVINLKCEQHSITTVII